MESNPSHRSPTLQKPQARPLRAFLSIMSHLSLVPGDPRAPWHLLERTVEKRRGGRRPSDPNPASAQPSFSSSL